jgi:hypothetical protein
VQDPASASAASAMPALAKRSNAILSQCRPRSLSSDIYKRINRIMTFRPKTMAGLAIVARAASYTCAEAFWSDNEEGEEGFYERKAIEAMCHFAGVTPLVAESLRGHAALAPAPSNGV